MSDALNHMAKRCERDGFFLGAQLALYRDARGLTDEGLAEWLSVDADGLTLLKLCRVPADETGLQLIGARFGARFGAKCRERVREVLGM